MALRLARRGITRVHPLEGGLARWIELGYPVQEVTIDGVPASLAAAARDARKADDRPVSGDAR